MKVLQFTAKNGSQILFDDFTDERNEDYCGVWTRICPHCGKKYFGSLKDEHLDDCGSGTCSVLGCENKADYYVDFWEDEDLKIIELD